MIGFSLLMVMNVISWDEALEQKGAWDLSLIHISEPTRPY